MHILDEAETRNLFEAARNDLMKWSVSFSQFWSLVVGGVMSSTLDCRCHMAAYLPPLASSSLWLPDSATWPCIVLHQGRRESTQAQLGRSAACWVVPELSHKHSPALGPQSDHTVLLWRGGGPQRQLFGHEPTSAVPPESAFLSCCPAHWWPGVSIQSELGIQKAR